MYPCATKIGASEASLMHHPQASPRTITLLHANIIKTLPCLFLASGDLSLMLVALNVLKTLTQFNPRIKQFAVLLALGGSR